MKHFIALCLLLQAGCAKDYSRDLEMLSSDLKRNSNSISDLQSQFKKADNRLQQRSKELAELSERLRATEGANKELMQQLESMQAEVAAISAAVLSEPMPKDNPVPFEPMEGMVQFFDAEVPGDHITFVIDASFAKMPESELPANKKTLDDDRKSRKFAPGDSDSEPQVYVEGIFALRGIRKCVTLLNNQQSFQVIFWGKNGAEYLGDGERLTNNEESIKLVSNVSKQIQWNSEETITATLKRAMDLEPDVVFLVTNISGITNSKPWCPFSMLDNVTLVETMRYC